MATFIILILWIMFSIGVGELAAERGRSRDAHFLLSILLSPIIGLLALLLEGKGSDDAILRQSEHMYYCPVCKQAFFHMGSKRRCCKRCDTLLMETAVLKRNWKDMSEVKKRAILNEFSGSNHQSPEPQHNTQQPQKTDAAEPQRETVKFSAKPDTSLSKSPADFACEAESQSSKPSWSECINKTTIIEIGLILVLLVAICVLAPHVIDVVKGL